MELDVIIRQMTLKDKIALCSGKNFWETKKQGKYGIPSFFMCDGPHGLRKQEKASDMLGVNRSRVATCFPAEVTTASTWDPKLLQEIGKAIGEEAKDQGVGLVLGPGVNIKRNPLCGRNFEYFSEDPYLAGKLAAGFIQGVEAEGVGTSLKHFAGNSQEKSRFNSDSIMDERTMREIYLTAFEIAVKEGKPSTVMCAYPKLNGVHCSDSKELLDDILRKDWGFDGMVVTDWGAMNDRISGFQAGCDLNMPGGSNYMEKAVLRAVKDGTLSEEKVDASVKRILKLAFRAEVLRQEKAACDYEKHHETARKAAEQGAVLLKNEDGLLPLKENKKIAVIGAMAKNMRYQGSGSSHINPVKLSQPMAFLKQAVFAEGCNEWGDTDDGMILEAVKAVESADVAVVFAGLPDRYESEGFDRDSMKLPEGHLRMIEAVAKANENTVVVLFSGSVVECDWADSVKAILYMGLPGQAGGEAVVNLLCGKANPCGKLAETWWKHYEDVPSSEFYGTMDDALYEEGIYVGYRYCEKADVEVRFPFGYGLSYTTFAYSDLEVDADKNTVCVKVTNTGAVAGADVVQLYIAAPQTGIHRPLRELKGFQKVWLKPGESETVSFQLDDRAFAIWQDGWKIPCGIYQVSVGELSADIEVDGVMIAVPEWQQGSFYENCHGKPSLKEWEKMSGKTYTPKKLVRGQFIMDNTIEEMKDFSVLMKVIYKVVEMVIARGLGIKKDYNKTELKARGTSCPKGKKVSKEMSSTNQDFKMMMACSVGSPLRSMQISGGIKGGIMPGLLEMANGHFLRGFGRMIKGE